jgi:dolichol-phosphate mannosyltransferase/undecaprenyl-phosphate 4-deoxy-4-formamido-L-arabinose transferase
MDDDLQHNPEDIPKFLALCDWDIVIGQFARKEHSPFKRGMSRLKGYFDWLIIGKPRHIQLSSYRMLNRTVIDGVLSIYTPNPFIPALMFRVTKRVTGVDVRHERRREGKSGYTLVKQIRLFSNLIINNSSIILRMLGNVGLAFAILSFCYAAFIVYRTFVHGYAVQGWSSLMVAVLLIGGLILFSVGIMGEYLIRIIETAETKPTYFVRRSVSMQSRCLTGDPRGD